LELSPQEGITIIEAGACSACRGTIRSVFHDFEQMGKMDEIKDLVVLVGPQAELPEDLEQRPLIMGVCLQHLKEEGRYVVGCPPNNDKMREAIMELTDIEP
jgi:coenzyme F420-reducing hydrogenase gamma subunit